MTVVVLLSGCGYSATRLLPAHYQAIYVEPFRNELHVTDEISENFGYRTDLPGLEEDVTRSVINRFILDGNLRVTTKIEQADLVINGKLTDFYRQPIRKQDDNSVEEYRLNLVASIVVRDRKGDRIVDEPELIADVTYFLTGSSARSETAAVKDLVEDFSRRIVERVIENW